MDNAMNENRLDLSKTLDHVLQNLMQNFGPLVFKEAHRFRGAILDEPIDHHPKKIRFLLTLAICDMKVFSRLLTVSMYELVDEMQGEYEINRETAILVIRAVAKLHNIKDERLDSQPDEIQSHHEEKPTSIDGKATKENERIAELYSSHVTHEVKTTKEPEPPQPEESLAARPKKSVAKPKERTKESPKNNSNENPKSSKSTLYKVGSIVYFGQYKWRILKINLNGTAVLITQDVLSKMAYHNRKIGVTWERSDMRKYLNGSFFSKFNHLEQKAILSTEVETGFNEKYFTQGGQRTIDKVFLLSIDEAKGYFAKDTDRVAKHERTATWWWLRSPGIYPDHAAFVYSGGSISLDGEVSVYTYENNGMHFVGYRVGGIRPALVVDLDHVTLV